MAAGLPLLLRLPPCLRQQLLQRRPSNLLSSPSFHSQTRLAAKHQPPPKPRVLKPASPPTAPRAAPSPSPRPKPPSKAVIPPKTQAKFAPRPVASSNLEDAIISRYAADAPSLLLYVAPSHRAFRILSLQFGIAFGLGAYLVAEQYLKDDPEQPDRKKPWYVLAAGSVNAFFLAIFSTTFFLGPTKLIQSVSVVKNAPHISSLQATRLLRIETKRMMPFTKPDVMFVPSANVMIDRAVRASSENIPQTNIIPGNATSFTQAYASGELGRSRTKGIGRFFSSMNRSLMDAWPGLKREAGRMFRRDNMAYIDIKGSGKFKLDLRDCYILDHGQPLAHFFGKVDPSARGTIVGRLTAIFRQ